MKSEFEDSFEYWIGQFFPLNTTAPEEYGYIDMPAGTLVVAWIHSKDNNELFAMEGACESRFLTPDTDGNVILDYCTYLA